MTASLENKALIKKLPRIQIGRTGANCVNRNVPTTLNIKCYSPIYTGNIINRPLASHGALSAWENVLETCAMTAVKSGVDYMDWVK